MKTKKAGLPDHLEWPKLPPLTLCGGALVKYRSPHSAIPNSDATSRPMVMVDTVALDKLRRQKANPAVIIEDIGTYFVPMPVAFVESLSDEERQAALRP